MGAPKGNNFWERRAKHGRDKLFATPQLMWDAACEYFEWCVANPLISVEYYGKDATQVEVPKIQAFTIQALCVYLDCNTKYFNQFEENIKNKEDELFDIDKDFANVITRIKETIYHQKFIHAAAGFLNANLISTDLGMQTKLLHQGDAANPIKIITGMEVK